MPLTLTVNMISELCQEQMATSVTLFQSMLTRRTLLKLVAWLPIVMAGIRRKKAFVSTEQPNTIEQAGYGTGNYGSSDYPGYATYLPLISKENR